MCKMNCVYAGTIYGQFGSGQHSCNYSLAMIEEGQEQKTRLGQLVKKYKLPSTHRKIMLLMRGENCPFFDPVYTGKKRRILRPKPPLAKNPRKPREKTDYIPPDADEDKLRELYDKACLNDRSPCSWGRRNTACTDGGRTGNSARTIKTRTGRSTRSGPGNYTTRDLRTRESRRSWDAECRPWQLGDTGKGCQRSIHTGG